MREFVNSLLQTNAAEIKYYVMFDSCRNDMTSIKSSVNQLRNLVFSLDEIAI